MFEVTGTDIPSRAARPRTISWEIRYARLLIVSDLVVVGWAVIGAQLARFGLDADEIRILPERELVLSYTAISVLLVAGWMAALAVFGTRDPRVVGTGPREYKRAVDASVGLFGVVAIGAFLLRIDLARSYILLALPIGLAALLAARWTWRQWLTARRMHGGYSARVVLVGSQESVVAVIRELQRQPGAGYRVVAACIPGSGLETLPDTRVPVHADLARMPHLLVEHLADTVIVTSSDELPPRRIRELSWELEPGRQHLVVAPAITDIGGPRMHLRPVAGLPLVHVETPRFEGVKHSAKRAFDILVASALIALLAPLLLVLAILVHVTSPGPVLFRQERVGLEGRPFRMLKFRSMVADAEDRLAELRDAERTAGNAVLFKMKHDPRITPLGRLLRRFSLDELPQLFNVLGGSMSLVGPRPPLGAEVAAYAGHVHRRFLVKPGITGLWQVSGRSNLSWEESVRLDLWYVENWSMTGDLVILWRTARAVVAREGAY